MSAMSSGWPTRPSAMSRASASAMAGSRARVFMSVAVAPGSTALTVMPRAPRSLASNRVSASRPALAGA
ncbi:Uncharacterised protein [Bordetella pertussis]|nr:Uncharacterised protein [Bordetella pertussis]CFN62985.1 Uncharacterised protein [Bordetella pertussis]CFU42927.1 Uncharacterised protein [Bordetella pertussis]CPJ50801.1 Uncharacterised protein [Bordetella pertussis]CPL30431.1 Uncharacterised protein [Bordetella pertussis]